MIGFRESSRASFRSVTPILNMAAAGRLFKLRICLLENRWGGRSGLIRFILIPVSLAVLLAALLALGLIVRSTGLEREPERVFI